MESSRLIGVFLAVFALAGVAPCSFAGSERLIMVMTPERMVQENLIHVRFLGPDGEALESDAIKQMVIREQDCSSGHEFKLIDDYKIGYFPEDKMVGIYLLPHVWRNKALCFSVSGSGKVEKSFVADDNNGHSIQLQVTP